jgi:hypothetical protein
MTAQDSSSTGLGSVFLGIHQKGPDGTFTVSVSLVMREMNIIAYSNNQN